MAILPGSLDYLYHYGILDHIPYEAYEMTPMTQSGYAQMSGNYSSGISGNHFYNQNQYNINNTYQQMNGSQYLQAAQQGELYKTYTSDMFVPFSPNQNQEGKDFSIIDKAYYRNNQGRDIDYEIMANGKEGKEFREGIETAAYRTKESFSNAPTFVKGLISGTVIIGTLALLLKGKGNVFSKLNPMKWFKK